jgi:hypothetical protein
MRSCLLSPFTFTWWLVTLPFRLLFAPFRWLFSQNKYNASDSFELVGSGDYAIPVVGESFYQKNLEAICGRRKANGEKRIVEARLIFDDLNPHDKNAIRIEIDGKQVGHLSREMAVQYRERVKKLKYMGATGVCSAVIRGGWRRTTKDGVDQGDYGVWLDIPEEQSLGKGRHLAKKGASSRRGYLGLAGLVVIGAIVGQFSNLNGTKSRVANTQLVQALVPATIEPKNTRSPLPTDMPISSRCLDVPAQLVHDIEEGLTEKGSVSLRVENAQAVKSTDHKNVYFIAVDIQGPGLDGATDIGVWASNALEPGKGMVLSVDAVAAEMSEWPKGENTKAGVTMADDGAREAVACLEAALAL